MALRTLLLTSTIFIAHTLSAADETNSTKMFAPNPASPRQHQQMVAPQQSTIPTLASKVFLSPLCFHILAPAFLGITGALLSLAVPDADLMGAAIGGITGAATGSVVSCIAGDCIKRRLNRAQHAEDATSKTANDTSA